MYIYPQEAENILAAYPAVEDVAVIGVPDEEMGEAVKALAQPADQAVAGDALAAELIAYCVPTRRAENLPRATRLGDKGAASNRASVRAARDQDSMSTTGRSLAACPKQRAA